MGVGESGDPFGRGGKRDAMASQARADAERDRQVGLAGAGRAEQDDVLFAGEEVELAEVLDDGLLDRALEGEVELLERLVRGEPGGLDALAAARGLREEVSVESSACGEALVAPFLAAGPLGQLGQRPGRRRRLQRPEQVGELGVGLWSCRDQRVVASQRPDLDSVERAGAAARV